MATAQTQRETHGFQTEVKQLLQLMIHSLYSNKEIFLRELISNASDAADKLRFMALSDESLRNDAQHLKVSVTADKEAGTVTISDNGIGMTRDEVIEHLGTIAKSGTKEFLSSLSGDQAKDSALIGQFGVGFYSSFIVADKVTVISRRAGLAPEQAVHWESAGEGEYTLENAGKEHHGTDVILHLKKGEEEFLDDWRLRTIINKYSDHIGIPVMMIKPPAPSAEGEDAKEETPPAAPEYEAVNTGTALWTRPKKDIPDDEYKAFYKHVSHDFDDPLAWSHNRVEGKLEYTSLLYIPGRAPFDLWNRERARGLKLYVQRVFIMDDAEHLMPAYLRFVKGVLDSNDLPLNVSREILQSNRNVETMRGACVKKVLGMLAKLAKDDKEKYAAFWLQFGQTLKEGMAEDQANKEEIAKLLRFSSTGSDSEAQAVSLEDYIARMKSGQDKIYYSVAESYAAAKNSPHLEIFRKKGLEVLLLTDRIDEWLVSYLTEFDGKPVQSVAKGALDLGSLEDKADKAKHEKIEKDFEGLAKRLKESLGEKVKEVRVSHRLVDSPACVIAEEGAIGKQMEQILKATGQAVPEQPPIFEINPEHKLVARLNDEQDEDRFGQWAQVLLDQAILSEGGQLDDPATFVKRLNTLFLAE